MRIGIVLVLTGAFMASSGDFPQDWGGGGDGYELTRDANVKHGGNASGSLKSTDDAKQFGSFTQAFRADKFKGKRLRMSAWVKTENVEGWSGLWIRVDGKVKTAIAFDNMMGRPIKGTTDWKKYDVVVDVPDEAEEITFGYLLSGKGQGWVDDFTFESVGKDVVVTTIGEVSAGDRVGELIPNLPAEPANTDFEK